jgi:hypothetical protein
MCVYYCLDKYALRLRKMDNGQRVILGDEHVIAEGTVKNADRIVGNFGMFT